MIKISHGGAFNNPQKRSEDKRKRRVLLLVEFLLSFFVLPTAIYLKLLPLPKFSILIMLSGFAVIILLNRHKSYRKHLFSFHVSKKHLTTMIIRFLLFIPVVLLITKKYAPEYFISFPIKEPVEWGMLMFLYPLFSALPQEILYRAFFFQRYRFLFLRKATLIIFSAISFSYLHIIYVNSIALLLTIVGGLIFSRTFYKTGSIPVTVLEHSAYGLSLFTAGLGQKFFM